MIILINMNIIIDRGRIVMKLAGSGKIGDVVLFQMQITSFWELKIIL